MSQNINRRTGVTPPVLRGSWVSHVYRLLPGILAAGVLGWFSIWFSDFLGTELLGFEKSPISAVMTAIVLGLVVSNVVRLPELLAPGLKFVVKKVLRLGIILLGIRLSVVEVFRLGAVGVPIVLGCIIGALLITTALSRVLRLPSRLGTLIAVGTSICGVSAIVATGPAIDSKEEEMAYAVSVITIFGIAATLAYPYVADIIFAGDPVLAGLFLGTAVHDTSQVTGSALLYGEVFSRPETLNVAVVTKLVRNIFMAFVIPLMAYMYARGNATAAGHKRVNLKKYFPLFVLGFVGLAVVRSLGDVTLSGSGAAYWLLSAGQWEAAHEFLKSWAVNFLVVALAGVGLTTRFAKLRRLGVKPFITGFAAAITVGVVSFGLITLLGRFIYTVV